MKKLWIAAVLALMPMSLLAQDFDKGMDAYEAGDYAPALQEWQPLADQGDAEAQDKLGILYYFGRGVPKDDAVSVT